MQFAKRDCHWPVKPESFCRHRFVKFYCAQKSPADRPGFPEDLISVWHSPNVAGVFSNHRLTGFTSPSLLKLRHVLHHAIDSKLSRRVRIGSDLQARILWTALLAPYAPKSEEETLRGSVSVDLLTFFPGFIVGDHMLEGSQGDAGATVVGGG